MRRIERKARKMRKKMPGTQTIQLIPVTKGSTQGTAVSVDYSEKRPISLEVRNALELDLEVEACVWALWTDELHGLKPKRGWIIVDSDGVKWQIQQGDFTLLQARYRFPCIRLFSSS